MPTLRVLCGVVAFALAVGAAERSVQAAPLDKRELEARADFAAGRYQKAVDTFAQLFADSGDPLYLRNIGRCYQKMKRPQEAIDSFQEYLLKGKNLSKGERQEIDGYIKEMQALRAAEAPASPAPAAGTLQPAPVVAPPAPSVPPPAAVAAPTGPLSPATPPGAAAPFSTPVGGLAASGASPGAASDGHRWRVAGIATAAGGVALIAVGLAYGAAARSAGDSVSKQYDSSMASAGQRDATLQWVGYGTGVVALATGALLYLHGREPEGVRPSTSSAAVQRLRWLARVDGHGGAMLLAGAF